MQQYQARGQNGQPIPILGRNVRVQNISVETHEMTLSIPVARACFAANGTQTNPNGTQTRLGLAWVTVSQSANKLTVFGCDSYAFLRGSKGNRSFSMGCMTICKAEDDVPNDGSCSGIGCCQIEIPKGLKDISVTAKSFNNHKNVSRFNPCTYAFVTQVSQFRFSPEYLGSFSKEHVPMVVDWSIPNNACDGNTTMKCSCGKDNTVRNPTPDGSGYTCNCTTGYRGNPYLRHGCQTDIDECNDPTVVHKCQKHQRCVNQAGSYECKDISRQSFPLIKIAIGTAIGFVALLVSGSWLYLVFKKRKLILLRQKFFRQNGGVMLQQKLSRREDHSLDSAKIFTEEELKKATLNYDDTTIIGQGGFGTVYKGFLPDNRIIAIKKSKLIDENQIEQFVNEVVILSQTNHRNVVKLLGCCLETQVPLLVYEFVPNGTLSEHIHNKEKSSRLAWQARLRIAAETAEALSYLHSSASVPIIHRDVKPSNILLDNEYTAKVSDFGASRLIPLDQTELATMVQGTLGYLDPEYLHTNQLTEKSDVYSFGVVLAELLTGKTAISFDRPEEERSLAMHFVSYLKRGKLFELVESEIFERGEGNNNDNVSVREQVEEVARLAKRCLNVSGEERPTMKQVAMELEGLIRRMEKHPWANSNGNIDKDEDLETEYLLAENKANNMSSYQLDIINMSNEASNATYGYDSIKDHEILDFSGR